MPSRLLKVPDINLTTNEKIYKRAYIEGVKQGLSMYAWWKDGEEYVGTCGQTLKAAISVFEGSIVK